MRKLKRQTWLTFHSKNTKRASIRIPARTARRMIHQAIPEYWATVLEGNTVTRTYRAQKRDHNKPSASCQPARMASILLGFAPEHILNEEVSGWTSHFLLRDPISQQNTASTGFYWRSLSGNWEGLGCTLLLIELLNYVFCFAFKENWRKLNNESQSIHPSLVSLNSSSR